MVEESLLGIPSIKELMDMESLSMKKMKKVLVVNTKDISEIISSMVTVKLSSLMVINTKANG